MLAGSEQTTRSDVPGDRIHTFLDLASGLSHSYTPASVTIYGNVVHATHGETRGEVLGSGDSSRPLQEFQLKQFPLTQIAAPTPSGIESTLHVRVNDILWTRRRTWRRSGPTTVPISLGRARIRRRLWCLATAFAARACLRAWRTSRRCIARGSARQGTWRPSKSRCSTKPLGVKGVVNPMPATGGADPDSLEAPAATRR